MRNENIWDPQQSISCMYLDNDSVGEGFLQSFRRNSVNVEDDYHYKWHNKAQERTTRVYFWTLAANTFTWRLRNYAMEATSLQYAWASSFITDVYFGIWNSNSFHLILLQSCFHQINSPLPHMIWTNRHCGRAIREKFRKCSSRFDSVYPFRSPLLLVIIKRQQSFAAKYVCHYLAINNLQWVSTLRTYLLEALAGHKKFVSSPNIMFLSFFCTWLKRTSSAGDPWYNPTSLPRREALKSFPFQKLNL